jgi:predicted CXXCH cytochrome family protein
LNGIKGLEDSDWEYTKSETDHNVYKGKSRTNTNTTVDKSTISFLCAKCHGKFHTMSDISTENNNGSSPWLRHPTDINLRTSGGEYSAYVYNTEAPVALDVIPSTVAGADYSSIAIVTCISCHRAHGSPYPDILRWDYSGMIANTSGSTAGTGCFRCHTTKDNQ